MYNILFTIVATDVVKPLYLVINKANEHIEENNGNKYLTLVLFKSKDTLKSKKNCDAKIEMLLDK